MPPFLKDNEPAKGWIHLYNSTTLATEVCNCGRPEGYKNPYVENRMYVNEPTGARVYFFNVVGKRRIHGHLSVEEMGRRPLAALRELNQRRCCSTCDDICPKQACQANRDVSGMCFLPKAAKNQLFNPVERFRWPKLENDGYWVKDLDTLMGEIARFVRPRTTLLSTLYSWDTECSLKEKSSALRQYEKHDKAKSDAFYLTSPAQNRPEGPVYTADTCWRKAVGLSSRWTVMDTHASMKNLWEDVLLPKKDPGHAYIDHIHFHCDVYRIWNNFILNTICN